MSHFFSSLEKKPLLVLLLFLSVAFALYGPSLTCGFILDDISLVVHNPLIKDLRSLSRLWTEDMYRFSADKAGSYYRPVLLTTFALDYTVWKLRPFGFRVTNILLHSLNSYLVLILLWTLAKSFPLGFIGATLFCIHPVHASAISFISGRADLLVTFFILLSLLYLKRYLDRQKIGAYRTSLLLFFLALASKESALLMPFLALLLVAKTKKMDRRALGAASGFFLAALLYLLARPFLVHGPGAGPLPSQETFPFYLEFFNTVHILHQYALILLFPHPLNILRTTPAVSSLSVSDALFLAALIGVLFLALKDGREKRTLFWFGFFWTAICLSPLPKLMHHFPGLGMTMAEHWLYLPSVGLFAVAGYLLTPLSKKRAGVLACLVLLYCGLAWANSRTWKNETSVYAQALKNNPQNTTLLLYVGNTYYEKGLYDKALESFSAVIRLNPSSWRAYNQIGNIYRETGRLPEALEAYRRSIEINPKNETPYINIGLVYAAQKNDKEALESFAKALEVEPESWLAFFNIGAWRLDHGFTAEAVTAFQRTLALNPDFNNARIGLAIAYFKLGLKTEALSSLQEALRSPSASVTDLKNISAVLANNGEPEAAIRVWEKALQKQKG
jgi:tetratricopeptide (TPR) repeat protein